MSANIIYRSIFIFLVFFGKFASSTDYDQYDYDWLTQKPPLTTPAPTKAPDDDDIIVDQLDDRQAVDNEIKGGFSNKQSFNCPHVKSVLHTGENVGQLSPEDITIMATMGDSLASGRGLWPSTNVEFRGAAFPIGGDANMDGLVTIPNILSQFSSQIDGVSHGMGNYDALPEYQYNVAQYGAETEDLPQQAVELVRRMKHHSGKDLKNRWALIIIVTGSEEFCGRCDRPSRTSLRKALGVLRKGIPKTLVVLLGPVHVASTYRQNINLMRPRCKCLEKMTGTDYRKLFDLWKSSFITVEKEFNDMNYTNFGVLAIPSLAIHSRNPQSLLVPGEPLLNRKGHSYAAKWLWNRLMAGPNYNFSRIALSQDSYYCPPLACPYFRTEQNFKKCSIITEEHWLESQTTPMSMTKSVEVRREKMRENWFGVIVLIIFLATLSVLVFGTYFYRHGKKATLGRFDYGQKCPTEENNEE